MILIFNKRTLPTKQIEVEVLANYETGTTQIKIGNLIFPDSKFWGRFIGALNRGALAIPDLTIII